MYRKKKEDIAQPGVKGDTAIYVTTHTDRPHRRHDTTISASTRAEEQSGEITETGKQTLR